jgi:CBS-domain-containing membrane protein
MIIAAAAGSPPAQPRSVIVGHVVSACIGALAVTIGGHSVWVIGIAAGISVGAMVLLRAIHAPAAATAVFIAAQHNMVSTIFAFFVGSVILVVLGLIAGRVIRGSRYPSYWL